MSLSDIASLSTSLAPTYYTLIYFTHLQLDIVLNYTKIVKKIRQCAYYSDCGIDIE